MVDDDEDERDEELLDADEDRERESRIFLAGAVYFGGLRLEIKSRFCSDDIFSLQSFFSRSLCVIATSLSEILLNSFSFLSNELGRLAHFSRMRFTNLAYFFLI